MTYAQFRKKFGDDKCVEQLKRFISVVEGIRRTYDGDPDNYTYNPDYYKARGVLKGFLNALKNAHYITWHKAGEPKRKGGKYGRVIGVWEQDSSISIHYKNYYHPGCTYGRLLEYNRKLEEERNEE